MLGDWEHARIHADAIRIRDDFPRDVGDALATIAAEDVVGYVEAVESVLESFETREDYLEDVPVADTVLVLQALAARRNMAAELSSELSAVKLASGARSGGAETPQGGRAARPRSTRQSAQRILDEQSPVKAKWGYYPRAN